MRMQNFAPLIVCAIALLAGLGAPARASTPADCHARVNSTEAKLLECITRDALWRRLKHFQHIADENPGRQGHGNRNIGTSGYRASVTYVARLMRQAGYRVTVQSYPWQRFTILGHPVFRIVGDSAGADWTVARLSGSGEITAKLQALRADGAGATATGCVPAEFRNFVRGHIALLRRGGCDFDAQVTNAQAAGATAVVLYNGAPALQTASRRSHSDGHAFQAQLTAPAGIPVIGALSYTSGSEFAARAASGNATYAVCRHSHAAQIGNRL